MILAQEDPLASLGCLARRESVVGWACQDVQGSQGQQVSQASLVHRARMAYPGTQASQGQRVSSVPRGQMAHQDYPGYQELRESVGREIWDPPVLQGLMEWASRGQ